MAGTGSTLIEFCGLVGTDHRSTRTGVYEPRHPNDRLLLGMKGTMSELELSILRQRSLEAEAESAAGELFLTWRSLCEVPCLSGCYPHPQHVGCCQAPE